MLKSGKNQLVTRKSFEVAYAIFRIAANIPDANFAGMLRNEAATLMANAAKEDYTNAAKANAAIEYFVKLATEVNFISFLNTEILLKEIDNLNAAIAESSNPAMEDIDLSDIFTNTAPVGEPLFKIPRKESKHATNQVSANEPEETNNANSEMRQTAIMERMRQSGNCRLKDIQEILPDCSERTLRYDLQSLIEKNLVERIGNGGPSVYYRVRQEVQTA